MEFTQAPTLTTTFFHERELLEISTTIDQVIPEKNPKTSGIAGTSLNLFSSTVGTGIIGLSAVFSQTGIIFGVVGVIVSTWFGVLTSDLILRCKNLSKRSSYMGFAEAAFKRKGYWFIIISQFASNLGFSLAYMIILGLTGQTLYAQLTQNCGDPNTSDTLCQVWVYPVTAGTLLLPLSYAPSMGFLQSLSGVKFLALIIFTVVTVVYYIVQISKDKTLPDINILPHFTSTVDALGSINVLTLASCFQFNLIAIYKSLYPQTDRNMKISIRISAVVSTIFIILVGVSGYAGFGPGQASLLQAFTVENLGTPLFVLVEGMFFLSLFVGFPIIFMEARNAMVEIFLNFKYGSQQYLSEQRYSQAHNVERKLDKIPYIIVVFFMHSIVMFIAALNPNLQVVFTILGATFLNGFVYYYPCMFYLSLSRGKGDKKYQAYFFILFGAIMTVFGLWAAVDQIGK